MSHLSLQMLTWGTIAGAVASAVLLAANDDGNGASLSFDLDPPTLGQRAEQQLQNLRSELTREPTRAGRAPSNTASSAASR
jgi:hypothetical protein